MKRARHPVGSTAPVEAPRRRLRSRSRSPETFEVTSTDKPWIVIVWNDPVNLIVYVCYVLQKLFGYGKAKAMRLTMQVHHEGKAVVSSGHARRPKPTSPDSTPTACGRRWSTPRERCRAGGHA